MERFFAFLILAILTLAIACTAVASPLKSTPCDNSTWLETPVIVGMNSQPAIAQEVAVNKCLVPGRSVAAVYVRGYTRSNGTYVSPHYRSDPDGIKSNNWSY